MLQRIGALFSASWYWILIFAVMAVLVFFLLQFQAAMREHMTGTIEALLRQNPRLCLERLDHNRRLKLLFRKPVMELWRLDAYMALGEDDKARQTISSLRGMKLEPREKLELYQKVLSFFAS